MEIKDGKNGCLDYDTIRVSEVGNPLALISTEGKNPRCYGEKNGVVSILEVLDYNNQVLSGLMYSINGGQYVSADEFPNLGQGTYKISVKDANGCLRYDGDISRAESDGHRSSEDDSSRSGDTSRFGQHGIGRLRRNGAI
ncbi:MAG: hypothetical protein IPQ10_10640 [Saprospiraceae bacterium]|nr:hypothetical protein [Saprospiraceae bacterium]